MRRAFSKDILRSITHSAGRFLAIAIIAALGTGFYAGLRMTGPDMRLAADAYFDQTQLYDIRVVSTEGMSETNLERLADVEGVEDVMAVHQADALVSSGSDQYTMSFNSLDESVFDSSSDVGISTLNRPILLEGSWPQNADECVIAADVITDHPIALGDTITVVEAQSELDSVFNQRIFTVVGKVHSSSFVCFTNLGTTSLGSGTLEQYAYVLPEAFGSDYPITDAYLGVVGARDLLSSSTAYDEAVHEVAKRIEDITTELAQERLADIRNPLQEELDEQRSVLEEQEQLASQAAMMGMLSDAERTELEDAHRQLREAQISLDRLEEPEFYVLTRNQNIGAESFESDSYRIDNLAQVFPAIFFLVAALVSLTTMTRMVDEERILIGTYKALGYSKRSIAAKYLIYAAIASGAGSLIGIVALSQFLPIFIHYAYSVTYTVPQGPTPIDPGIGFISALLGIGITLVATGMAVYSSLRETPAALMLPRAPKAGKRILLERVRPLWSRLSFLWKVTARNIFRYKRRFLMAIIGIAGCSALLLTGLGLQNAINDIINKQFYDLTKYHLIVRSSDDLSTEARYQLERSLSDDTAIQSWTAVQSANMIASSQGHAEQRVEVVVPQDTWEYESFFDVRNRESGQPITLDENSVVLSEKLASELGAAVGDRIVIREEDAIGNATGRHHSFTVTGIMENYVGQTIILGSSKYAQSFGTPSYSTYYAKTVEDETQRQGLLVNLLESENVTTASFNDETIETYRTMLRSVDSVVVVLVVAAAVLAFVVLYNLTNINISERQREIATLKVLGFTNYEVSIYIYREIILLSLIGALVGMPLGVVMEHFVVLTAEVDQVMFGREIHLLSFVLAFVLTLVFTAIVMLVMRRKLHKIDMVESLKSIE